MQVTGSPHGKHLHVSPLSYFQGIMHFMHFFMPLYFQESICSYFRLKVGAVTVIDIGETALMIMFYEIKLAQDVFS